MKTMHLWFFVDASKIAQMRRVFFEELRDVGNYVGVKPTMQL